VALLREHWRLGRLTLTELESRCEEALNASMVSGLWHAVRELPVPVPARPAAPEQPTGAAVTSLVLGLVGMCVLLMSFGLLCFVSLPLTAVAWGAGRRARLRGATGSTRGVARAGEALGAIGTILGCLSLAGWALIVWAASG
jgi:hypothetical protein